MGLLLDVCAARRNPASAQELLILNTVGSNCSFAVRPSAEHTFAGVDASATERELGILTKKEINLCVRFPIQCKEATDHRD